MKHKDKKRLKRFRESERKSNERWWKRHLSIEAEASEIEECDKEGAWESDNGVGVESLVQCIDGDAAKMEEFEKRLHKAYIKVRRKLPWCLDTFNAIIRNGNNREKSICELQRIMQMKSDARRASRGTGGTSRGGMRRKRTSGNSRG